MEAKRFNDWDVDELITHDISDNEFHDSVGMIIKQNSSLIFCQLWRKLQSLQNAADFGGGIRTMTDIQDRLFLGSIK